MVGHHCHSAIRMIGACSGPCCILDIFCWQLSQLMSIREEVSFCWLVFCLCVFRICRGQPSFCSEIIKAPALLFFLGDNAVAEFTLEELTYSHSGGNGLKKQWNAWSRHLPLQINTGGRTNRKKHLTVSTFALVLIWSSFADALVLDDEGDLTDVRSNDTYELRRRRACMRKTAVNRQ